MRFHRDQCRRQQFRTEPAKIVAAQSPTAERELQRRPSIAELHISPDNKKQHSPVYFLYLDNDPFMSYFNSSLLNASTKDIRLLPLPPFLKLLVQFLLLPLPLLLLLLSSSIFLFLPRFFSRDRRRV